MAKLLLADENLEHYKLKRDVANQECTTGSLLRGESSVEPDLHPISILCRPCMGHAWAMAVMAGMARDDQRTHVQCAVRTPNNQRPFAKGAVKRTWVPQELWHSAKDWEGRRQRIVLTMRVDELETLLGGYKPCAGEKRACVAVVLRHSDPAIAARKAWKRWRVQDLEALFILRAMNERDRWGGQVGLPGGRQNAGESDEQTAKREVLEEVGLDLDLDDGHALLGRVHDRRVPQGRRGLVVSCHVYLQLAAETAPLELDASEVAACGWCSVAHLSADDCGSEMMYDLGQGPLSRQNPWLYRLSRALALDRVVFTQVQLPIAPLHVAGDGTSEEVPAGSPERAAVESAFVLWGLTLSIVNDWLFEQTRIRKRRIAVRERVAKGVSVERVYDNAAHNMGLGAVKAVYRLVRGESMPWSMYIRLYPVVVIMLSAVLPILVASKLSKL